MDLTNLKGYHHPEITDINIYTDGSKTKEHTGAGYVIFKRKAERYSNSIRMPMENTVFQAEVLAIREAIKEYITLRHDTETSVKVFTNSQAALLALSTLTIKSRLVYSTIMELNKLVQEGVSVEICWIKAHIGQAGNKRADQEARQAEAFEDIYNQALVPFAYFKSCIKAASHDLWKQEWIENPTCRMSKKIFYLNQT